MTTKKAENLEQEAISLEDFLLEGIKMTDKVRISDRIPFEFEIEAMSNETYDRLQKQFTTFKKKGRMDFDSTGFNIATILECCKKPNFKDAEFVKKAGVISPQDAVRKLLLPGEVVNLASAIQSLSGFDKDLEELKDEAKNF